MSIRKELSQLLLGLESGGVSRRAFVEQALGLGLSVGTIGAVLTACSGGEAEKAPEGEGGPQAGGEPGLEPELHIYNWSDYIAEDTIPNFEKEFGVKVTYDTYESNEEFLAKLQAGASGYDIIMPSGYVLPILSALGLVGKLDKSLIPNWGNIAPLFINNVYDPKAEYGVPWQWGLTGLAYRADLVSPAPDSWAVLLDGKLKGRMTMMDEAREVIGAFLKFRGKTINSVVPEDLAQAKADAIAAKANLKSYVSAPVKAQLIAGDVALAQLWNGDTLQAKAEKAEINFAVPKEGCPIWTDYMVITETSKNKRAAHAFINYILRAEVGAALSSYTGYGSPNQAALAKMENPPAYPTEEELKKLEFFTDLGEHTATIDQIWIEIKSA